MRALVGLVSFKCHNLVLEQVFLKRAVFYYLLSNFFQFAPIDDSNEIFIDILAIGLDLLHYRGGNDIGDAFHFL